jgi:hypothetical protein
VDPRAGLDDVEKWKFLTLRGLKLRFLGRQPVASRYTDYAIVPYMLHKVIQFQKDGTGIYHSV